MRAWQNVYREKQRATENHFYPLPNGDENNHAGVQCVVIYVGTFGNGAGLADWGKQRNDP